ncbi:MAG: TonB-dependent receptor [Acidobacteriaceae bacterium]
MALFPFATVAPAAGQVAKGSITGTVTDTTSAALQGAQIKLKPETQTATTDAEGHFTLTGLPPGHYTVTISYLGFQPFTSEVDINTGAATTLNASMAIVNSSQQVTVRAEREVGEAEALNRQRVADHIVQVLPAQVINSLPNTNIADAVGRLPSVSLERDEGEGKYIQIRGTEPRLSNVTIDGIDVPSPENVRNVKLDVIPADLVESVELSKTLSANQDGNAIGGSVNLVTRTATDQPYFAVEGLLGHTPIAGGRGLHQVSSTYGRRFLEGKKLGLIIGGSYDWNGRGINDIEPSPAVNTIFDASGNSTPATVNAPNGINLRDYHYDRTRFGFAGTLDYRLSDVSSAYLRGLYSHFNDNGENWNYILTPGNFTSPTTTDSTGSTSLTNVERKPVQQIWSLQAGAHQEHGNYVWNYRAALSQAHQVGGFSNASFGNSNPVQFDVTQADPFTPQFTVRNGVNIYDPAQYSLSGLTFQDNHAFERDLVGELSLARRYTRGSKYGAFEAGFKMRDVIKSQLYNQSTFNGGGSPMSNFLSSFRDTSYYFGRYTFGPVPRYDRVLAYYNANTGAFTGGPDTVTNLQNDFRVSERVYAGYGMNTITISRVRLQTGLRFETTQTNVRANALTITPGGFTTTPTSASNTYTYALPSIQAQYNSTSDSDIRVGYGIGIARPNYGDLAPYQNYDPTGNPPVVSGNPNLKPTWAHNFDLLGEKYLKQVGLIQLGVFYKQFYQPIYVEQNTITTGPLAGLQQQQPVNGPSAHLLGLEASFQQHLTFLPGALNGTGFRGNYSYTTSRADVPGRSDHPSLLRDAPSNWNIDATYDKYRVSARMGITHNDGYIWAYSSDPVNAPGGLRGPNGDNYLYPHTQLDAQASYLVPRGRGLSVIASFLNLTNEVFGFYNGSERYPNQREYYSPTYTFGLRWSRSPEN